MLVTFVSSCEETINDSPDVDANSICNTLYGVNYKDPSDEDVLMNLMNDIRENTIKTLNDNSGNFDFAVNTLKNMNDLCSISTVTYRTSIISKYECSRFIQVIV